MQHSYLHVWFTFLCDCISNFPCLHRTNKYSWLNEDRDMLCAADEDSLAGICTSSQKHISDRQTGWKADRQTETCCVELMRNPCWSLYIWSEANFRGLWLRCRSCSTCNHSLHCWFLLYQFLESFSFSFTIFTLGFFLTSLWSFFLFLSQYLLWVSSWPVCGVFFFFFHNIYFGFLLYQFVGVFCFFHSLMISSWSVCSFLSSSFTVFICNFFFTNLWGFLSFSFVFFSSLFFFFFHNLYL